MKAKSNPPMLAARLRCIYDGSMVKYVCKYSQYSM